MYFIYRPSIMTKGLVCIVCIFFSQLTIANEIPCGERRLFKDGTELTLTYDAAYHYVESGSVSMKDGFVAKPGFSIKPSLNCSQTRPALEELAYKYAPKIYHSTRENYHLSSVEWYLDRSQIGSLIEEEKWCYDCEFGTGISDEYCWDFKLTPEIQESSECTNERFTRVYYPEAYWHAPLPSNYVASQLHLPYYNSLPYSLFRIDQSDRAGNLDGAKAYIHIRRTHFQDAPYLNDDIEIQYHYFYPWNGDQGGGRYTEHEGDWETVRVMVDSNGEFLRIFASAHGDWNEYSRDNLGWEEGHPVIYSANESHAMYNDQGYNHPVITGLDYCDKGPIFRTWEDGNYEIVEVSPEFINTAFKATNPSWLEFTGRWGTNPEGPVGPKTNWNVWNAQASRSGSSSSRYSIDSSLPQLIDGASNVCNEATYALDLQRPSDIQWSTNGPFVGTSPISGILIAKKNSGSGGSGIIGATALVHYVGYDIKYNVPSKGIWLGPPTIDAFTLNLDHEFLCSADASISYDTYFDVSSVDWSIEGYADLGTRDKYKASLSAQHGGGGYTVYADVHNSCGSYEKSVSGTMDSSCTDPHLRVDDQQSDSIAVEKEPEPLLLTNYQLFPNPTTGEVKIGLVSNGEPFTNIRAEIFDYSGRVVESFRVEKLDVPFFNLDLSAQEKGLYLVRVFQEEIAVFESKILKN